MKFSKVKKWSWKHFFRGTQEIFTTTDVSEPDVRNYIDKRTDSGSGNWDTKSLTCVETKVKETKLSLTNVKLV